MVPRCSASDPCAPYLLQCREQAEPGERADTALSLPLTLQAEPERADPGLTLQPLLLTWHVGPGARLGAESESPLYTAGSLPGNFRHSVFPFFRILLTGKFHVLLDFTILYLCNARCLFGPTF